MVQNINKLKGKITENGYSIDTLALKLGLCNVTLRKKITGSHITMKLLKIRKIKSFS